MKKIIPLLGLVIMTSSCGLIMSEEDGNEKPQDTTIAKATEEDSGWSFFGSEEKPVAEVAPAPAAAPMKEEVAAAKPAEEDSGWSFFGSEEKPVAEVAPAPASAPMKEEVAAAKPAEEDGGWSFFGSEEKPVAEVAPEPMKVEAVAVMKPIESERAPVAPRHEEIRVPAMADQSFDYYKVSKDETLMMVAFRIYGDYRKWKDVHAWNKKELKHGIHQGMSLKYQVPEQKFVWEPSGLPYMVKEGNTLGSISSEKYGTTRKWKDLYENNRPLIIDPNVIFAGFTIYYVPTRDIASQKK